MIEKCDICIPTFHRASQLNDLLASIIAIDKEHVGCVVIGITGPKEESVDYITDYMVESLRIQGVQTYMFDGSSGLMDTKNRFKKFGSNEIILMLDDDTILTQKYMELIYHFRDKKVGAVSGTYMSSINDHYKDWSDKPQDAPDVDIINKINYENGDMVLDNKLQVYMLNEPRVYRCETLVGSAVFARRQLLEFDMFFQSGTSAFEEYDYTLNIRRQGYDLIYDSSAMIFHNRGLNGGMRKVGQEDKIKTKKTNAEYMMNKWGGVFNDVVVAVDFDGTIVKSIKFGEEDGKFTLLKDAKDYIKQIHDTGACVVLYTTRKDNSLDLAVKFCKQNRLEIDYYNECPSRWNRGKIDADVFIDDKATVDGVIDWEGFLTKIKKLMSDRGIK